MIDFVYCAKGKDHALMAVRSAETVRKHHPTAEIFLYTDDRYDLVSEARLNHRVEPWIFKHPFMLANVMAQNEHLLQVSEFVDKVVFLDNDIIMRNPLGELIHDDRTELHVTWRDNVGKLSDAQPYNYGVLIVQNNPMAKRAMMWLEERVSKLSPDRQKWYGNQIALRELVGPLRRNESVFRDLGRAFFIVEQLPCHKYNWTPPDDKPKQSASDKIFIHLKGDRKDLFGYYYDKVMNNGGNEKGTGRINKRAQGRGGKAQGKDQKSTG